MEKNIGVGAIVGLAFASSIYVWNNDKFSSKQKIILLICIIFPPAQWLGILIISIYNSNVENNTPERKTEKKLDSTISNLKELKGKGILSKEEYNSKVKRIKAEKTEQNLKNSLEYKQLKSLFDSRILTKEEFETKIQLLQKVSEKELNTKEINKIIDSTNKTYFGVVEEKKESLIPIYIGSILFFTLLSWGIIVYSNKTPSNSEDVFTPPAIDTSTVYDTNNFNTNYQESLKAKKFVYVVLKVEKPTFNVFQPISRLNSIGYYEESDPTYSVIFDNEIYYTDIIEVENYDEDKKYKVMDNAKNKMGTQLEVYNGNYRVNVMVKCKDESKVEDFQKISSKITETQIYEFDSYSEASISKENRNTK